MALQSGIESFIVVNYLSNLCETIWKWDENYRIATRYSLFVDYRVQLESLPSVYGQLSHTPKSLKRLYGPVRVVCLGSIEQKVDDYLATNISEEIMNNEEIAAT